MKCPSCLLTMSSKEYTRAYVDDDQYYMSLHCWSLDCPARKFGYQSHMSVLVQPAKQWVCQKYHLPFQYKEKWFALVGEPFQGYLGYPPPLLKTANEKQTTIYQIIKGQRNNLYWTFIGVPITDEKGEMVTVPFIPISTDDDMHEQARHLFDRLIKLMVFT